VRILALELSAFRNYAALRFEPPEGACVLVGANAQGKSNLLEALALLSTGKSFRTARESDLIKIGSPAAAVSAAVRTRHGDVHVQCVIARAGDGARKRFFRQGRAVRYADFLGGVYAVTFAPSDLQLVGGPAGVRRRMLNAALSQIDRSYYRELAAYTKAIAQKNALLRSPPIDRTLLETYNDQIASRGAVIVRQRATFVRSLSHEAGRVHAQWVGAHPALTVEYEAAPAQADESPGAIEAELRGALLRMAPAEMARGASLVGPHRDDFAVDLGGEPLARFGSQGQQRSAVLALKSAEYVLLHRMSGEPPLLLLDDVLSELDAGRRRAYLESLGEFDQAFITATDPPSLPAENSGLVIAVEGGTLRPFAQVPV
jgi:DNA replication and repair protein RecF